MPAGRDQSADVAGSGWAGITVSIAWALLSRGVRIRPAVLRDVRDHVLYHLDPGTSLPHAEDRARQLTVEFASRARRQPLGSAWPRDAEMPLSPRWHRALVASLRPLSQAVFRHHYGDGRSLDELGRLLQVDALALEMARSGLREVVRRAADADGVPLDAWPSERLDQLIGRLAAWSPGPCPPLHEVIAGEHPQHVSGCARCDRAARLIQAGVLGSEDLIPPRGPLRDGGEVAILALHFHPDGRQHREALAREAQVTSTPVGEDVLLLDWSDPEPVRDALRLATEVAAPHRDHVRGAVLQGPGRWSRYGLLGPLATRAAAEVRTRSWGSVDTLGELPEPLPDPPSPRRWWTATAFLGLLAVGSTALALAPPPVDSSLVVDFAAGRGGVWAQLDVDEAAFVTVVREVGGGLQPVFVSATPADKGDLATGDGRYRLHSQGQGLLVVASDRAVGDLPDLIVRASMADEPLADLARRLEASDSGVTTRAWHE